MRRALRRAILPMVAVGCQSDPIGPRPPDAETIARLTIEARPGTPTQSIVTGYTTLGLATPRDGHLYVPSSYDPGQPTRLLVLLHGAGADRSQWMTSEVESFAELRGAVVLAIESRYDTWDVVQLGRYDPDVAFLEQALEFTFDRVNVDPALVAIGGFSDGAAEALGIGIANAGLFRKIIAFTPSTYEVPFGRGAPDVFVSHGRQDTVVPFGHSQNVVVPRLRNNGMEVFFQPFDGDHIMPEYVQSGAFDWLTG